MLNVVALLFTNSTSWPPLVRAPPPLLGKFLDSLNQENPPYGVKRWPEDNPRFLSDRCLVTAQVELQVQELSQRDMLERLRSANSPSTAGQAGSLQGSSAAIMGQSTTAGLDDRDFSPCFDDVADGSSSD